MARNLFQLTDIDKVVNKQLSKKEGDNFVSLLEEVKTGIPSLDDLEPDLGELITLYYEYNSLSNGIKKPLASYNTQIKTLLKERNLNSFTYGPYSAKITEASSSSFLEDVLILKIKQLQEEFGLDASKFIKTREYVDMEEFERSLYDGTLNAKDFSDCQITSTTQQLRVKKGKEVKDEKVTGKSES